MRARTFSGAVMAKLVMPGLVPGIHVLVPGIHVLAAFEQEERGWPGRSPAMTENDWQP
jgi:hypothetical protein